jgi:uncharacterized repeat protein (TIGR01451 family)
MKTREREKESRDSIVLMLLILLLGFICIIITSGWALRFSPSWRLPTNMGSNLNPDSDFLTRPVELLEPLDPAILTDPAWNNVFLTPSASFVTRVFSTPTPTPTTLRNVPPITDTPVSTVFLPVTNTLVTVPTNTQIYFPPASATPKPKPTKEPPPTATNTPVTSVAAADLQITKTDGVATYVPGGTLTYTITVINNGPSNVAGAVVSDNFSSPITGATWTCTSSGGASCTANGTGSINQTVDLPVSSNVTYTVNVTISAGASGNLTNTATISSPVGDPVPGNNSATDADTPFTPSIADLQITKDDGATDYEDGGFTIYTIVITNNGPGNVVGALISDTKPANISFWTWACTSETSGLGTCTPAGASSSDFSDTIDLPVGASIAYMVPATIVSGATGPLTNTVTVNVPAGYTDPSPGNNSDSDSDQLIVASSFPYGQIGTAPDGSVETIASGAYLVLQFGTPLVASGPDTDGYDLVYYPDPSLQMDLVIRQIGDGSNWYTIFNWGDGSPDANTDINPSDCPGESDNCVITAPPTNSPGVSIQIDGLVPDGNYPYIRIISPPDSGDGVAVDAITVLP